MSLIYSKTLKTISNLLFNTPKYIWFLIGLLIFTRIASTGYAETKDIPIEQLRLPIGALWTLAATIGGGSIAVFGVGAKIAFTMGIQSKEIQQLLVRMDDTKQNIDKINIKVDNNYNKIQTISDTNRRLDEQKVQINDIEIKVDKVINNVAVLMDRSNKNENNEKGV